MLELDGGEGGGQVLRTALSLSMLTGRAFEMRNVRAARPSPGLKPQHRTAVDLAARCCDADVEYGSERAGGDENTDGPATTGDDRPTTVTFRPGTPTGGEFSADVGTAGSLALVFDTVLPLAVTLAEPLTVTVAGGTDVKWAPTSAYYRLVKLPLLARFGLDATVEYRRHGYYPVGGGKAALRIEPSNLKPIDLVDRGDSESVSIYSAASTSLSEAKVARRQADAARERLADRGITVDEVEVISHETKSPGSVILVYGAYERTLVGVDELGARGKPAESVGVDAAARFLDAHERGAVVDRHAADQVLVFLAASGGRVRVPRVTDHVRANCDVLGAFGVDVQVTPERDDGALVEVATGLTVQR